MEEQRFWITIYGQKPAELRLSDLKALIGRVFKVFPAFFDVAMTITTRDPSANAHPTPAA